MTGCGAFPFSARPGRVPCEVLPAVVCTYVEFTLPDALSFEDGNDGRVEVYGFHLPLVLARHPPFRSGQWKMVAGLNMAGRFCG